MVHTETFEAKGYEIEEGDELKRIGNAMTVGGDSRFDKDPDVLLREAAEQFIDSFEDDINYDSVDDVFEALQADPAGTLEDLSHQLDESGYLETGAFYAMDVRHVLIGNTEQVDDEISLMDWKTEKRFALDGETLERHLGKTIFVTGA